MDFTNTRFFGLFAVYEEEESLDELRHVEQAPCFTPAIFVRSHEKMVGHTAHASGHLSIDQLL